MAEEQLNKIVELLQQIDSRLKTIEDKVNAPSIFDSISYDDPDSLLPHAVEVTLQYKKASASIFQRHLQIGYARAARILDQMSDAGIIGKADGAKPRKIFVDKCNEYLTKHEPNPSQNKAR